MESILSFLLVASVLTGVFFVISNVIKQREAEKHLESLLSKYHEQILRDLKQTQKFKQELEKNKTTSTKSYIQDELLLITLKSVIDKLGEDDRVIMEKSFGKKSDNDQKRYAHKIFNESGLNKVIGKLEPAYY